MIRGPRSDRVYVDEIHEFDRRADELQHCPACAVTWAGPLLPCWSCGTLDTAEGPALLPRRPDGVTP